MVKIPSEVDLLVVGGGINGTGIARDAAGRGLSVLLCEQHDLAQHTSSASSKLVHGGLRYLEQFEFRLVRESLQEREVLLRAAPHLVHAMRFVMPHVPALRPAWMIRIGLFLYDYLARRDTLPDSQAIESAHRALQQWPEARPAKGFPLFRLLGRRCPPRHRQCACCRRLGCGHLATHAMCSSPPRQANAGVLRFTLKMPRRARSPHATLVNVAGPWAKQILNQNLQIQTPYALKLVKGSHIVVPRLYEGPHAFILQNDDGRVVFAYPYEGRYTLIGTNRCRIQRRPRCVCRQRY